MKDKVLESKGIFLLWSFQVQVPKFHNFLVYFRGLQLKNETDCRVHLTCFLKKIIKRLRGYF